MRNRRLIAAGLAVLLAFPIGLSNISAEAAEVMSQSGNNSDSYKKVTVDPGSGYSIVETEDYTCTASHDEFEGVRYTVKIGRAVRYLYREGQRWYVDRSP